MALGFFDARSETPDSVRKRRDLARSLLATRAPQNTGEGIMALSNGFLAMMLNGQAADAESAGQASGAAAWAPFAAALGGGGNFPAAPAAPGASAVSSEPSRDTSRTGSTIDFANAGTPSDLDPYQRALLDTIAGPESAGKYDVMYGGGRFTDFSDHPRKAIPIASGPNVGRTSSAAGKYQFLGSTWDDQAKKLGLTDFSPASQDKAAWNLAAESYRNATGGDLDAVLRSGDANAIAGVGKALAPIWTSLPGGIEQGTNTNRFLKAYNGYLGQGGPSAALETMATQDPVRVASLDPATGVMEAGAEQGLPADNPGLQALARVAAQTGTEAAPLAAQPTGNTRLAQAVIDTRAPEMAGNGSGGPGDITMQQIMQAMGSKGAAWMPEWQQKIIGGLYDQRLQQQDPAYQMGLEKTRTELDLLKNPRLSPYEEAQIGFKRTEQEAAAAKAAQEQANSDRSFGLDERRFTSESEDRASDNARADAEYLLKTQPDFYSEYVKQEMGAGRTPLGILDYAKQLKQAGATNISNVNGSGNSSKFMEESDKAAAGRMNDIIAAGAGASQFLGDIQQIAALGGKIGTGVEAQVMNALGPYAQALGVEMDGLGESQAYSSIISRLAPQMRPAGSGAASDFDARQFLNSLPSLGNTPDGNRIITDTFQAIQMNKIRAAEIASLALVPQDQGGISWQEAEKQIRSLPNPYETYRAFRENEGRRGGRAADTGRGSPAPATKAPATIDGYTIEEIEP